MSCVPVYHIRLSYTKLDIDRRQFTITIRLGYTNGVFQLDTHIFHQNINTSLTYEGKIKYV